MKKDFLVLHWSENWMDGLSIKTFSSEADAEKYVRDFQSNSNWNKADTAKIVEVKSEYEAAEIDHRLFGLRPKKV